MTARPPRLRLAEHCKHRAAAESLVSAQQLLEGEELALAKVTAGNAWSGARVRPGIGDASPPRRRWPCCSCTTRP